MSDQFPHKQGAKSKEAATVPYTPPKPQGDFAAKVEPPPSVRYHLFHAARDVAIVAGLSALTYLASDDFANMLKENPELAAWVPLLQVAARAFLVGWGKTAVASRKP